MDDIVNKHMQETAKTYDDLVAELAVKEKRINELLAQSKKEIIVKEKNPELGRKARFNTHRFSEHTNKKVLTNKKNVNRLVDIMEKYDLYQRDICSLLNVSSSTVCGWLYNPKHGMDDVYIEILAMKGFPE